ncbi:unnamed protein product [Cochlearia groenlandica]
MPIVPPSAPGSSSQPGGQVRKDSPPKRLKISAKSVLDPIGTKQKSKIPKEIKPKTARPIHFFTSSKSKLSGSLGNIRTLSESGEPLELVVPEPNQRPWNCPPAKCPPIYPFPSEYLPFKEKFLQKEEVPWVEVVRQQQYLAGEEEEERLADEEVATPPPWVSSPTRMEESVVPGAKLLSPKAKSLSPRAKSLSPKEKSLSPKAKLPASEVKSPLLTTARTSPFNRQAYLAKRAMEAVEGEMAGSSSKRARVEPLSTDVEASAEKERDLALAKVSGLEKDLQLLKKEKKSRKLKEKLREVELENADLKKKFEVVAESSKARDLALEESREAVEVVSAELAVLRERYDGLCVRHGDELARLRRSRSEHVAAAKVQLDRLRDASETRLGKLKAYLEEEVAIADKYLLFNQMRGVFGTIEQLKTQYAIDTPPIFERQCREKEGKLRRWLEDRDKFSYEPSDFVLPSDIEIGVPEEVSEPEDEVEMAEADAAGNEVAEVVGDASLPEESGTVGRGE